MCPFILVRLKSLKNSGLQIALITDKNKKLNFNIRLNDKLVSKFSKKREDISNNNVLEIRLSNENLNEYEQKLEFIIENPISPLDLYESPDSRNLGLLVKGYKIK